MSLSWPRIVPSGKKGGEANAKAIAWYRDVLLELKANGITPFVTLYHWDHPQSLQEEYGGWLSEKMIVDFEVSLNEVGETRLVDGRVELNLFFFFPFGLDLQYYSRVCFENFGDLVENWFTVSLFLLLIISSQRDGNQSRRVSEVTPFSRTSCS